MTVDQQEKQILRMVSNLPVPRRIRLALTILQGVAPEQIPVDTQEASGEYRDDIDLANTLNQRRQEAFDPEISRSSFRAFLNDIPSK